ncbi:hypothetical protein ANMWB30_24550 [Arthrobacter sp. MWB30]|nr:hypothetical protein ANMWB30_24550 [Arthrobacter sp. MWB30]
MTPSKPAFAFVLLNGKMFSGKDSVADHITSRLRLHKPVARITFSDVICTEVDPGIDAVRNGQPLTEIAAALQVSPSQAQLFVDAIAPDLAANPSLKARDRTSGTRFALQMLGQDWRWDGYWAAPLIQHCTARRDAGEHVVLVGARWPAEFDLACAAGAFTVRLDVSEEVQNARSLARDGHIPQASARNHPSETSLDHAVFDVRIDTDHLSLAQVVEEAWNPLSIHMSTANATNRQDAYRS